MGLCPMGCECLRTPHSGSARREVVLRVLYESQLMASFRTGQKEHRLECAKKLQMVADAELVLGGEEYVTYDAWSWSVITDMALGTPKIYRGTPKIYRYSYLRALY